MDKGAANTTPAARAAPAEQGHVVSDSGPLLDHCWSVRVTTA